MLVIITHLRTHEFNELILGEQLTYPRWGRQWVTLVENPKRYKFAELDAAQLPRSLPDVDAAAVNNNYAVQGGSP